MTRPKKTKDAPELVAPRLHYAAGELSEGSPECWGLIAWSNYAACYMIYFFDGDGDKQAAVPVEDSGEVEWTKSNLWRFSSEWHAFNKWKEKRREEVFSKYSKKDVASPEVLA